MRESIFHSNKIQKIVSRLNYLMKTTQKEQNNVKKYKNENKECLVDPFLERKYNNLFTI